MKIVETLDQAITHPVTVVSVVVGTVGSLLPIPIVSALISTAWHQAGTLFAGVSVLATQGWLPAGTGQAAMLVAGALFLGRNLDKLWDGLQRRLKE
jgi:hypothetical protein